MKPRLIAALAAAFIATGAVAPAKAQVGKLPVEIEADANDPVGRQLTFYLRDTVGRSGTFQEVDSTYARGFKLSIVTLDPYKGESAGTTTIYSLVILAKSDGSETYLTHYVGSCVTPQKCAGQIFGFLGDQTEQLRRQLTSGR